MAEAAMADIPAPIRPTTFMHSFWLGLIAGTIIVFSSGFGMTLAAGRSVVEAAAVGGFAAIWGGPGFGGMMAGIHWLSRQEPDD